MGRIIIKHNDTAVNQVDLRAGDMKIGRRAGCDIVLDHLAVSGEHANIATSGDDSVISDLNSTNGTFIGNKRITKHPLRNGDVITIGQYALVYVSEPAAAGAKQVSAPASALPDSEPESNRTIRLKHAQLFVLNGANSGKRIDLVAVVTNIGKTGKHAGTIARTVSGYLLEAVKSPPEKLAVNGIPVPAKGVELRNGDIIDVGETQLQFYFK